MKNKIFALALIAVSLVACTKNEDPTTNPKAVATASMTVPVKVDDATNMTGKSVNRGNLPVSIDEIDVTATSTQFTFNTMTPFLLSNLSAGATATNGDVVQGNFKLDNVAVGNNNISVVTSTVALPILTSGASTDLAETLMATLRSTKPFAIYTGGATGVSILQGVTNTIPTINLTTVKGRNIAVFKLSDQLKALGVKAIISANGNQYADITVDATHSGDIYWNSENATGGAVLGFTVTLYDGQGNVLPAGNQITPPNGGFKLTNVPATSTNTIFTIGQSGLISNETIQTFTAQWTDNAPTTGTIGN